jgi:hypothetical protein
MVDQVEEELVVTLHLLMPLNLVEQEIVHQLVHHKEIMVETELLRADQEVEVEQVELEVMLQIILEDQQEQG